MLKPYILTIDDDKDFNNLMRKVLSQLNAEVKTTATAKEFIDGFKIKMPDLCIIDLNLDRNYGAGFQLIELLRKKFGHFLPLIVMSKRSSKSDISNAFELGASDFITKPLDDALLISKIRHFLEIKGKMQSFGDTIPLPMKQVAKSFSDCQLQFQIKLIEISEFGIKVLCSHFLSRGTVLEIDDNLLKNITKSQKPLIMSIHQSTLNPESRECEAFLEFDYTNGPLINNVRNWLVNNTP